MEILRNSHMAQASVRPFFTSARRALKLLQSCPAYTPPHLSDQAVLADRCGVDMLYIKDESSRMKLGSFKALGGAFAVAQMITEEAEKRLGRPVIAPEILSETVREIAASMTFITASAGNHGLSVAAGCDVFGANAVIVLSQTVPEAFARRIEDKGAEVVWTAGSYDGSVAEAVKLADERGWLLLADGSWPGYTQRPAHILEGYTVLAEECRQAFDTGTARWPTHVFLQAGVGGPASAVVAHVRDHWASQPEIIVVEPDAAPCLMRSVEAGELVRVEGPDSNMGRLDGKDASLLAFEALRQDANMFVTTSDAQAREASEILGQADFPTTPSGAAGFAALMFGRDLGIGPNSRCLVVASEGSVGG